MESLESVAEFIPAAAASAAQYLYDCIIDSEANNGE